MKMMMVMVAVALGLQITGNDEVVEVSREIAGAWTLEFTDPDDQRRTPTVVIGRQHDELVSWYIGNDGIEAFSKVRLDDDSLHMTIKPKEFNGEMAVDLVARLDGEGRCEGVIEYEDSSGDAGRMTFTGEKIDLSSYDEVHNWQLKFVTPDEIQRTPTVTVIEHQGDSYAWYSSDNYQLLATKLTTVDDQVEMAITTKSADGEVVDVTFKGTVDGDRVSGEVHWELNGDSGSFPFTGTKTN